MGVMNMQARKEYSKVVRERYWKARCKKEKSQILDEYCANIQGTPGSMLSGS